MYMLRSAKSNVKSTRNLEGWASALSRQLPLTRSHELGTVIGNMLIQRRLKGLATAVARTIMAERVVRAPEYLR